jgi:hypothetical protein
MYEFEERERLTARTSEKKAGLGRSANMVVELSSSYAVKIYLTLISRRDSHPLLRPE